MSNFILLGTTDAATTPNSFGLLGTLGYIALLGVVLYFLMIRPQRKQQKKMNALLSTLAAGDSVVTSAGFYGVVIDVMEDVVIVEFGNNKNCRIPMKKSAIAELEKPSAEKNA
jgi:preprotein translocase subunit YajC